MQIHINIEKKHLWLLILVIVAVGFVVAYGGTNPSVMGHSFGEVEGVPINCIEGQSYSACQSLNGAPNGTWTDRRQIAAFSAEAYIANNAAWAANSAQLGGYTPTQYCRTDGTGCNSGAVYKIPANYNCQNSAFLCATSGSNQIVGPFVATPQWNSAQGVWIYRYFDNNNGWQSRNCAWVLCSQPDPALP